jgi:hypothetical protein
MARARPEEDVLAVPRANYLNAQEQPVFEADGKGGCG